MVLIKSELQAQLLEFFQEIEKMGEEVVITDNDRPVIRIEPLARKRTVQEVFGHLQGKIVFHEDPDTPTIDEWEDA